MLWDIFNESELFKDYPYYYKDYKYVMLLEYADIFIIEERYSKFSKFDVIDNILYVTFVGLTMN